MKVHFLGGADEVGASCLYIEIGGQRILVDAGMRVSPKARDGLSGELLPDLSILSYNHPDAVIITHAHADHIGAIPLVASASPHVPIYATPATFSLMNVMYKDSLQIMDIREKEGELPSYDEIQVRQVQGSSKGADFRREFSINQAVNVTFYRAGHIPGAATVFLQADEGSILVSGDLSFSAMRATPVAEIPPIRPNILILESTYGGRLHANRVAEEQRLIDSVTRVIEQGGRVLIPAFALGRAQEVALILDAAIASKKMGAVPIYMDGLTRSVTQVFERFPDYLSKGLQKHLEDSMSLFRSKSINFVGNRDERNRLIQNRTPAVIIASSGMLTGGASAAYAQFIVGEKDSAIFITGYQDEESPGKALQSLASKESNTIFLGEKKFQVECEVGTYSLSAHADENELVQYASQLEPEMVYLVHGDKNARNRVRDLLVMRKLPVHLPRIGEMAEFTGEPVVGRRKNLPSQPEMLTPPISSLSELATNLPLYNASGELYLHNARRVINQFLPPETGVREVKFNQADQIVRLTFDYPLVAVTRHSEAIDQIKQTLGWEVELNQGVNSTAMQTLVKELVPAMLGNASIYVNERVAEIVFRTPPENWAEVQSQFLEATGFQLVDKNSKAPAQPQPVVSPHVPIFTPTSGNSRMEINQAYQTLRQIFEPVGLYKSGLKGDNIILSFLTPEVGSRYASLMEEVANMIGYGLTLHPHPNQFAIIELVTALCQEREVVLVKNPSINVAEKLVTINTGEPLAAHVLADLNEAFEEKTGWKIKCK